MCYHCVYNEANGQIEEGEGSDLNCKSNPELTVSSPCTGECITMEFTQRINITILGEYE